jgi:hypothetical protein
MRLVGTALAALVGSSSVIGLGYAGAAWILQSELSQAAAAVSNKAMGQDRLDVASLRYAVTAPK